MEVAWGKTCSPVMLRLHTDANLNLLHVHAHVLPPEFHKVCDRAGMLVWQDFPLQWGYSDELEFRADAVRQMRAMITGLYNHPSIIAWCCHNEVRGMLHGWRHSQVWA